MRASAGALGRQGALLQLAAVGEDLSGEQESGEAGEEDEVDLHFGVVVMFGGVWLDA